jgi:hypothetical protein
MASCSGRLATNHLSYNMAKHPTHIPADDILCKDLSGLMPEPLRHTSQHITICPNLQPDI